MSSMAVSDREFGELISDVRTLKRDLGSVQSDVSTVDGKVDSILSRFDRIDGGWKVLMAIGSVAGVVGGVLATLIIKVFPFLFSVFPK